MCVVARSHLQGVNMAELIRELRGGNMDIDLIPKPDLEWQQEACP